MVISRALRRPARIVGVLALTAPLAGALVLSTAAPASAAQSAKVTLDGAADGDVLSSAKDVTAIGSITNTGSTSSGGQLVLEGPTNANGDPFKTTTGISGCSVPTFGNSCSKSASASFSANQMSARRNGHWTATVNGSVAKGFYTNFKPTADPSNLAAAAVSRTEIDLSWSYSGTELDKAGFEVVETHNGSGRSIFVPAGACNGSTCGYAVTDHDQPNVGTTEDYSYTVTALRSSGGCSSCGSYTRSGPSSSASAHLVGPPPPPSPTPSPTGGTGTTGGTTSGGTTSGTTGSGSTGGATGGSTGGATGGATGGSTGSTGHSTGGSTGSGSSTGTGSAGKPVAIPTLPPVVASRKAFALGFNKFSPSLGIPKLPPLPATTFPVTAPSDDTYQPTLPYANQPKKTTSVLSAPISAVTSRIDTAQLAKSIAVALLLLACAAHVRMFLSAQDQD
ncbi:MAG TPA: hypothetical protein VMZ11_01565 [Mycobacteriales bacterium]|nr:hypothetical protein [Mycobacteriales bacterium]